MTHTLYSQLGSCTEADIAARVMTRVLSHQKERNQLLVDCGFTALTKQGFGEQEGSFALIQGGDSTETILALKHSIGSELTSFEHFPTVGI